MMLVIYGPTATGKTALALQLARKFQGELISADSRQVYRGLDIGTGKVALDSKILKSREYWVVDGVKIHGFDLVGPGKRFSVVDFCHFADVTTDKIIHSGKLPIIVGGTGFYIKSFIEGIEFAGILPNPKLRKKLEKLKVSDLFQKLKRIDPSRAKMMNQSDRANRRRLIRAIEIAMNPLPKVSNKPFKIRNYLMFGLTAPNSYLYARADHWFNTRLKHGLTDEVKRLLDQKVSSKWLLNLGLEYRWITRYLLGKVSRQYAIERLKGDIHNFIRRQKTWFGKFKNTRLAGRQVRLFDISKKNWQRKLEKEVELWYTRKEDGQ